MVCYPRNACCTYDKRFISNLTNGRLRSHNTRFIDVVPQIRLIEFCRVIYRRNIMNTYNTTIGYFLCFVYCLLLSFVSSESQLSEFSKGVQRISDGTGYLLLAPSRFLVGTTNRMCLSRFGEATSGMATAHIDLLPIISLEQHTMINTSAYATPSFLRHSPIAKAKKIFSAGDGGCFDVKLPNTRHTKVWLNLRIRFDDLPHYRVSTKKKVQLQHGSMIAVIQTDKPIYRCGETVSFRVLQLEIDLTPLQEPINSVSIEAPSDLFGGPVKVMQWNNVSTQMGLIQLNYILDKYAVKGEWKISVQTGYNTEIQTSQSFYVAEYDLPNFYVTTIYPKNILLSHKQIVRMICAKYMYGESVKGKLHLKVYSDAYDSKPVMKIYELTSSKPCLNYTTRTKSLGFNIDHATDAPTIVVAEISVQEIGTRTWRNTTSVSRITNRAVKVEFANKNKLYILPGLPFQIKVHVVDCNDEAIKNAKVKLCRKLTDHGDVDTDSSLEDCEERLTDTRGYAVFSSSLPSTVTENFVKFVVTVVDHPLKGILLPHEANNSISATKYVKIWSSTSKVHMDVGTLQVSPWRLAPGTKHIFPLYLTFGDTRIIRAITLHFAVMTRGGILFSGGSYTLCPSLLDNSEFRSSYRDVPANTLCFGDRVVPSNAVFYLIMPIKISHQMCPQSHMVVYFVHDGELVVASKYFKVTDCFHKVSQKWIPNEARPSSLVHFRLYAPVPALCATAVSDAALKHVASHASIQIHIMRELKHFVETRTNITAYILAMDMCFKESSSLRPVNSRSQTHYRNTVTAFKVSGVEILSDLVPDTVDCPAADHYMDAANEIPAEIKNLAPWERSYFPETWLWELHLLDSNGTIDLPIRVPDSVTRYESHAFCVSRSGVLVTPQTHSNMLKVFQPFFIDLDFPKRVKRNDTVELLYKVYNYMETMIPVSVSLILPAELSAQEPASHLILCVPQGQSVVHKLLIKPRSIGTFNVSATAHVDINSLYQCHIKDSNVIMRIVNHARDAIVKPITVIAEGRTVENYKSALLCTDDLVNNTGITWTFDQIKAVQQTEEWVISVVGDIIGPISLGAEKLLSLPVGCGEQNMAMMASNLVALNYLQASGHLSYTNKEMALRNLRTGYQRQLRFRLADGSFSAFGSNDGTGSTWLTAFTLKILSSLKRNWHIGWDDRVLGDAMQWLLEAQMENGCFRNDGQVFHREIKGGLHSESANVALASFVVISLIDAKTPNLIPTVLENAAYCLAALKQRHGKHKNDPNMDVTYTFALATLAEIKIEQYENQTNSNEIALKHPPEIENLEVLPNFYIEYPQRDLWQTNLSNVDIRDNQYIFSNSRRHTIWDRRADGKRRVLPTSSARLVGRFSGGGINALKVLRSMAIRSGDLVWWEAGSLPVSIETTAYAILSLLSIGGDENWIDALGAVKWLSKYRNKNGGFISTQDTLVALEAIYTLVKVIPQLPPHMNISVETEGFGKQITVSPYFQHTLHQAVVSDIRRGHDGRTKLKIKAVGTGCVLLQVTQRYNTVAEDNTMSPFVLNSKITTEGLFNCKSNDTWCKCAAILEICVSWNSPSHDDFPEMAVLEVNMPSGYAPDRGLLYELIKKDNILLRRIEDNTDTSKITMYLSLNLVTANVRANECYNLYLVGPQVGTSPSLIFLYDYYHTEVNASQTFAINEECSYNGNRRPHEEPPNLINVEQGELKNEKPLSSNFQDWHIRDSDSDLNIPSGNEGNYPTFVLPPEDFTWSHEEGASDEGMVLKHGQSWTNVDFELDFPDGMEGVEPSWVSAPIESSWVQAPNDTVLSAKVNNSLHP